MTTFAASETIDLIYTTPSVVEDDSKIPPIEIDYMSTTFNETMEDGSKLPSTSALALIDPFSTLLFIGKHNIYSLTAVPKFLDMIINIL